MKTRQPILDRQEHARRGRQIYQSHVRPIVEQKNSGKVVAIDVETREFEIADDTLNACERLLARLPDAQIWCVRVGHPGVHRFGARTSAVTE